MMPYYAAGIVTGLMLAWAYVFYKVWVENKSLDRSDHER